MSADPVDAIEAFYQRLPADERAAVAALEAADRTGPTEDECMREFWTLYARLHADGQIRRGSA